MRKAMVPVQVRLPVEVDARVAKIRKRHADYTRSDFIRDVLVKLEGAPADASEAPPFWEVAADLVAALPADERRAFPKDFAEHHDRYRRRRRGRPYARSSPTPAIGSRSSIRATRFTRQLSR